MRRIALTSIATSVLLWATMPAAGADTTGKEVFDDYCIHCHGPGNEPGTMQLGRTRGSDKALLAERTDLAPEYIEYVVRHGLKSMPAFVPSDLTDAKLRTLVDYLAKQPEQALRRSTPSTPRS